MKNICKLFLSFTTLSLFALGCQQKDVDVDPRDQYIGTYTVSGTQNLAVVTLRTFQGSLSTNNVVDAKITVSKGSEANQIKISVDGYPDLTSTLESNTFFVLPTYVQDKTATGFIYYKAYEGNGSFVNNKINFNSSESGTTDQVKTRSDTYVLGSKQ